MIGTYALPSPPEPPSPPADTLYSGPPIAPIERIRLFSSAQWEEFVLEWAHSLKAQYALVNRCGGAGDMGRDVVAITDLTNPTVWENFQCKHYDHPLAPSDIWLELGKLVYYTHQQAFTYPTSYKFVAPQGVGTKLSKLLEKTEELKAELIAQWDGKCRESITGTAEVPLDANLRRHLDGLDFSIIGYLPPLTLLEQHRTTPWHVTRFGGGLPTRPPAESPPEEPTESELQYLRKLFDAYTEHCGRSVDRASDLAEANDLLEHYRDSRVEFYSAESLRGFSRDTLPAGTYETLQDEVYAGIRDTIRAEHTNGFGRVVAVVQTSRQLQITGHALVPRLHLRDRGGICHQLANDKDEVRWVRR
jgi:hypothetical protein